MSSCFNCEMGRLQGKSDSHLLIERESNTPPASPRAFSSSITTLPAEILSLIFSALPISDLQPSSTVCRLWNHIILTSPETSHRIQLYKKMTKTAEKVIHSSQNNRVNIVYQAFPELKWVLNINFSKLLIRCSHTASFPFYISHNSDDGMGYILGKRVIDKVPHPHQCPYINTTVKTVQKKSKLIEEVDKREKKSEDELIQAFNQLSIADCYEAALINKTILLIKIKQYGLQLIRHFTLTGQILFKNKSELSAVHHINIEIDTRKFGGHFSKAEQREIMDICSTVTEKLSKKYNSYLQPGAT